MSFPLPIEFDVNLHPYYLIFSAVSVLTSAFVIVSYISLRKRIQHPAGVQLWRSVFDLIFAGSIVALAFLEDPDENTDDCHILGPIFQFSLLGSQCWYFVLSFDLLFSLFNPFSDLGSNVLIYHLFVWILSGGSVVFILFFSEFGWRPAFQLCWIRTSESSIDSPNILSWTTFFIPTLIFLIFGVFVTIVAYFRIHRGIKETLKLRMTVLKNTFITNIFFTLYWIVAGGLYIILYTQDSGQQDSDFFGAFAVVIGGLGVVDAVVWILTQGFPCKYCRKHKEGLKPINYALRREIIHNTAQGICDNLDRVSEYERLKRPPEPGTKYYPRHLKPNRASQSVFLFAVRDAYSQSAAPFYDYAPRVFSLIREIFGVSDGDYKESFEKTLLSDSEDKMKERFTEGKSGSFFYFTPDGRYLVKTMYKDEVYALMAMLPAYTHHVYKYRNTLLCKIFGLHCVEMYDQEVYFVVMESVFLTDLTVHERYDLKGSTHGRYSKQLHLDKEGYIKEVLKDLDIHKRFMISRTKKILMMKQVKIDVDFLSRMNIMDYSMLVGVRYVRQYRMKYEDRSVSEVSRAGSVNLQDEKKGEGAELEAEAELDAELEGVEFGMMEESENENKGEELLRQRRGEEQDGSRVPLLDKKHLRFSADSISRHSRRSSDNNNKRISVERSVGREGGRDINSGDASYPRMSRSVSRSRRNGSDYYLFHQHQGGVKAEVIDGPGVYYFGIIDILQRYSLRKRLEHFFKCYIICRSSKKISCVNPRFYARRFIAQMNDVTQTTIGELSDELEISAETIDSETRRNELSLMVEHQ